MLLKNSNLSNICKKRLQHSAPVFLIFALQEIAGYMGKTWGNSLKICRQESIVKKLHVYGGFFEKSYRQDSLIFVRAVHNWRFFTAFLPTVRFRMQYLR